MYKLPLYLVLNNLVMGAILDHPFSGTTPLIGPLPSDPTMVPLKGFHCIILDNPASIQSKPRIYRIFDNLGHEKYISENRYSRVRYIRALV